MTYLEEYNNYAIFAKAGYKMFSFPVLFAGRWISATEGLTPFHSGIFDRKDRPDFSSFEHSASMILEICPDALLIPRINVSMPVWWTEENPECLDGTGKRELLGNGKWKKDVGQLLGVFLKYLMSSQYADHIAGLHIAGGNTEEWFYFDLNGGCCENAMAAFKTYLGKYHPECEYRGLPDLSPLGRNDISLHGCDYLRYFLEFSNDAVAESIIYLAAVAKRATDNRLAVGTFYGYSLEVSSSLQGAHALKRLLECKDVDFICSPNSYIGLRDSKTEWTEMYPADSVRLHGKMCMQECDIRTHLTKPLPDRAPEYDPGRKMTSKIWQGLDSKEESIKMIRKSFDRQLKKGNGLWWFDMWGGWYDDADIMLEMSKMQKEYVQSLDNHDRKTKTETAVFIDEDAYGYMTGCALRYAPYNIRKELGEAFENYDIYDMFDFDSVKENYNAFVFLSGTVTPNSKSAVEYCRNNGKAFLVNTFDNPSFSVKELKGLNAAAAFKHSNSIQSQIDGVPGVATFR